MSESDQIFVDTNVFLRYMTNDVPEKADAVEELLMRAETGQVKLITNSLVIAEIVWTLASFYHLLKINIQEKVKAILNTPGVEVVDAGLVDLATRWYAEKNVDFIDAYNAAWMQGQGLQLACTFDSKHFSRFENLSIILPVDIQ